MLTSLYGLYIEVPPGWHDITEYCFEAPDSLLTKLVFSRQTLLPHQVDPWLQEIQSNLPDELTASPIVDYENPRLKIRGFNAVHNVEGEREGTSFIVVCFPETAVIIQPYWHGAGEALVKDLVRTLRPHAAGSPAASADPNTRCFIALGLLFATSVAFSQPASFAFESLNGRGRLWCRKRPRERAFEEPSWTTRFDIGMDPLLAPNVIRSGQVVSQRLVPPELTGPIFEQMSWTTTASVEGTGRALTWAEARTDLDGEPFRIWLAYEVGADEALATWLGILASARRG